MLTEFVIELELWLRTQQTDQEPIQLINLYLLAICSCGRNPQHTLLAPNLPFTLFTCFHDHIEWEELLGRYTYISILNSTMVKMIHHEVETDSIQTTAEYKYRGDLIPSVVSWSKSPTANGYNTTRLSTWKFDEVVPKLNLSTLWTLSLKTTYTLIRWPYYKKTKTSCVLTLNILPTLLLPPKNPRWLRWKSKSAVSAAASVRYWASAINASASSSVLSMISLEIMVQCMGHCWSF